MGRDAPLSGGGNRPGRRPIGYKAGSAVERDGGVIILRDLQEKLCAVAGCFQLRLGPPSRGRACQGLCAARTQAVAIVRISAWPAARDMMMKAAKALVSLNPEAHIFLRVGRHFQRTPKTARNSAHELRGHVPARRRAVRRLSLARLGGRGCFPAREFRVGAARINAGRRDSRRDHGPSRATPGRACQPSPDSSTVEKPLMICALNRLYRSDMTLWVPATGFT